MNRQLNEDEIVDGIDEAMREGRIYAVLQPQINHSTGRMVGAEALMRWNDPENGLQMPGNFIPILESYDMIYEADLCLFEDVCKFIRSCLDEKIPVVPISCNVSRYDVYQHDYVEQVEKIRKKYDIPVRYLRFEITESSAMGGLELVLQVLKDLHKYGYLVEMDDFGSGYSSLNVLKDLDVDIIKLDMRFLRGGFGGRGGTIVSSIVQMTRWLNTQIIAEGVETAEQADFMESLGCYYIQGYYYSEPLLKETFLKKLKQTNHEPLSPALNLIRTIDAGKFWEPESLETLIFSNFVGAAAIFTYKDGKPEILRINKKYIKELGMNLDERAIIGTDPWEGIDDNNRAIYDATVKRAIESGEEETCETCRILCSDSCGNARIWIRTDLRVIGNAGDQYLIYAMIQNITTEKEIMIKAMGNEKLFKNAFDQINVFAWEYIFENREMHPCFRCMRELGLPPVVENYPDPVFESGLFPMDYKDMYYDMLKKLEEGEKEMEAVIPLTAGRIPFRVKYTTEFDENGKPLKAYGSAVMVTDEGGQS